jgi:lysine 2,3-aminomutase
VYTAPSVKPGKYFLYFDPLHQLSTTIQRRWQDPIEADRMVTGALENARAYVR